jgi:acyl-CoA thioesterase I
MRLLSAAALSSLLLVAVSCGSNGANSSGSTDSTTRGESPPRGAGRPAPSSTATGRPRIVALGDSLTAGLGLSPAEAYPAVLQRRLDEAALGYEVVNAGVSGDTSAGGLRRVDWALEGDVRIMILALGANDGLRGLPTDELARNLSQIIERAQARKVTVILAGMEAPPNFGLSYVSAFRQVYQDVAKRYDVAAVPFLLDGVAGVSAMNQGDGIHPTSAGASRVAANIWPVLEPIARAHATP